MEEIKLREPTMLDIKYIYKHYDEPNTDIAKALNISHIGINKLKKLAIEIHGDKFDTIGYEDEKLPVLPNKRGKKRMLTDADLKVISNVKLSNRSAAVMLDCSSFYVQKHRRRLGIVTNLDNKITEEKREYIRNNLTTPTCELSKKLGAAESTINGIKREFGYHQRPRRK